MFCFSTSVPSMHFSLWTLLLSGVLVTVDGQYGKGAYTAGQLRGQSAALLSRPLPSPQLTRYIAAAPAISYAQPLPSRYDPIAPPFCRCNTEMYNAPVCGSDGVTYNSICDLVNAMSFTKNLGFRCDSSCPCKFSAEEYISMLKRTIRGNYASCLSNGTTVNTPAALQTALIFDINIGIRCDSDCALCYTAPLRCPSYPLDFPPHMLAPHQAFGTRPVPLIVTRPQGGVTAAPDVSDTTVAPRNAPGRTTSFGSRGAPTRMTTAEPTTTVEPIPEEETTPAAEETTAAAEETTAGEPETTPAEETTPEAETAAPDVAAEEETTTVADTV